MSLCLTKEQEEYRKQFKRFAEEAIIPYAKEHDEMERLNDRMLKYLKASGYLGSMLPKEYQGMDLDMVVLGLLNEEIGRGCASVRSLLTVHGMAALGIWRWGTHEQKNHWLEKMATGQIIGAFGLSEPDTGSDAKSVKTSAISDGEYVVLNGNKKWITMGQIADLFIIFANFEGSLTAFLIERDHPGFSIKPITGMLGVRGSMLAELHFHNCRIPASNMLGKKGMGITHVALSCLDYGRYTVAWGCIGTAQAALEASLQYSRSRVQFGTPLLDNQLIQKMITEMVVELKAARLLCLNAGRLKDQGDQTSIIETWMAKYFSSIMVNHVAGKAVQIHGGNGCSRDYPVERYFRDAKINEIIEGTTQIHEILIATNIID